MPPKRRMPAAERKASIVRTTIGLIAKKGFKAISIRDIAAAEEINEALIYKHFASRKALLGAAIAEVEERQRQQQLVVEDIPQSPEEFARCLSRFAELFLDVNEDGGLFVRMVLFALLDGYPLPDAFDIGSPKTFLRWLVDTLEHGKAHWGFANRDSAQQLSMFIGGLIYYVLQTQVSHQFATDQSSAGIAQAFAQQFVNSLKE